MKIAEFYPELEAFLLSLPGVTTDYKEEWDWTRFMLCDKQFLCFCCDGTDNALITVKCEPEYNDFLRNAYPDVIIPGYYCNKLHWSSVRPAGGVPEQVVREMALRGYHLIRAKLPKRVQATLADVTIQP